MSKLPPWFVVFAICFFAVITVVVQEQGLGFGYLEGEQFRRHTAVLNDTAPNPWNYRPFAEWMVEIPLAAARVVHLPHPVALGFLAARLGQNLLIFACAWLYYQSWTLPSRSCLIGLMLLSFCFMQALYNADLSFNTYFDVLFYLAAALLVVRRQYLWLIPLSAMAALNRETGAGIPLLASMPLLFREGRQQPSHRRQLIASLAAVAVFAIVFIGLRVALHKDTGAWQNHWGNQQGWPTLKMNFGDQFSWINSAVIFSVLPLIPLVRWRSLPFLLKAFYIPLVVGWTGVHWVTVYAKEARYYLVPVAVVLIPALLWPLPNEKGPETFGP